ncbi:hypothetical protein VTJ49DRAFT_1473 [Mycothermus thermophilus]|uniref:L-ornithine N(5)-oxygenase n=1 Tax=Humicola insolens TaxID=85995 RepID=A0ABR3VCN8_HUMIN
MGGIGKTSIAIQYAHSRRAHFDAIFWVDAAGGSQLASNFARIATKLELQSPQEADSLEASIKIAKAWLSQPRNTTQGTGNWLLIFDNADDLDIIEDYVPDGGSGSVLVTSRDQSAKNHFYPNGSGKDVDPLSRANASTLLRKLLSQTDEAQDTDENEASMELAAHFDGLPLALIQMAGFIRRRQLSIREFMTLYASDARYTEVHNINNRLQRQLYGHTLATTYGFEGLGHHATRLLQMLAFLNPDRVQEYIFISPPSPGDKNLTPWPGPTFESARYELLSSSLIKRNIQKKELWIHRAVQVEVRTRIDEFSRYRVFKETVALVAKVWPPGDHCSQKMERWARCEELMPHLERFYQLYLEYSEVWDQEEADSTFPWLLNEAAVYLHERGFSQEAKPYLKLALALCEQSNITQEPLISDMHLCMGALANETNDAQTCMKHNILMLNIRKAEAAKGKKPDLRLAFAYSQMGIAYMMVRKVALATEYFRQSVTMLRSIETDPDNFAFPQCNLGLGYWMQGKLGEADETLTELLEQRERLYGKMDTTSRKTGRVLHALGNFWDESLALHQACLKQYESTVGRFNHRTADACHKLAEHAIRRGEHDQAQAYLDRALNIWGDRPWYKNESARSSFLRGTHLISLEGKENIEQGNRWVERAKALRREILPDEEPKELETADFDDITREWTVTVDTAGVGAKPPLFSLRAPIVVLCTGARPVVNELPVQISQLPLYTGLSRPHLTKILPSDQPRTIAVIGSGHSAVLVLRNLAHLASTTHPHLRIRWLTRTPHLTYPSHTANSPNGPVITNQYDGLTGKAADFARAELDGDALQTSPAGQFITRIHLPTVPGDPRPQNKDWVREQEHLERPALTAGLQGCDFAIQAVGFTRARLPELRPALDASSVALGSRSRTLVFNSETGSLYPAGGDRMSAVGLFGAGSGFPEVVPTPEMVKKPRVGVWWFMKFVKKMAPMWALATRDGKFPDGFSPQGRTWFGGP